MEVTKKIYEQVFPNVTNATNSFQKNTDFQKKEKMLQTLYLVFYVSMANSISSSFSNNQVKKNSNNNFIHTCAAVKQQQIMKCLGPPTHE